MAAMPTFKILIVPAWFINLNKINTTTILKQNLTIVGTIYSAAYNPYIKRKIHT